MEKQMTVNRLPSPTWNRLQVNSAVFPAVMPEKTGLTLPEAFAAIPTGMGREAEAYALALSSEAVVIEAAEGETLTREAPMDFVHSEAQTVLIHAHKGSKVTVFEAAETTDDAAHTAGSLTKVIAEEGAEVTLIQLQLVNDRSAHFFDVGIREEADATVRVVQALLGGDTAMTGVLSLLAGERAAFHTETVYFGDGKRRLDMNFIARHEGRRTTSEMKAAGALLGESDKIYRGTIDFQRGCAKAAGREAEETLLFSDDARNRTVPLILCSEEDVDGQHAASIGRINAARLFYLQSRGLSEAQVRKLTVDAQFAPVLAQIPDEALRERIEAYLERRMQLD